MAAYRILEALEHVNRHVISILFSIRAKIGGSRNLSDEISYLMKPTDSYLKTN